MSESTRALCQIIERRPFLTLTNEELELVALALAAEAARHNAIGNGIVQEYASLCDKVWQEARARRQSTEESAAVPEPERCSTHTVSPWGSPLRCEDKQSHDGPHFITNRSGQRR
jgi:hypothetical protein